MAIRLSTSKDCRHAYREILQGISYAKEGNFYIKHFKEADLGFIESSFKECAEETEEQGLYSRKNKLQFLYDEGYWTHEEEEEFLIQSLAVKDAHEHHLKLSDPEQKEAFKTVIKEQEEKLKEINKARDQLVEPTVEGYCNKRLNEFYVYNAVFKDKELKEHLFSEEEFDDLSYIELSNVVREYNRETSRFSERNVKIIAVNNFFLNAFFMCDDDPVKFYGKNVLDLTMYQMNLFSRGKFYKSVLIEGKEPPEHFYEESHEDGLFELSKWYESSHNSIRSERETRATQAGAAQRRARRRR